MAFPQERCPGTEGLSASCWAGAGWRAHTTATGSALLHPSSEAKLKGPEQLPQRKTSLEPRPSDEAHTSQPQRKELGAPLASVAGTVRKSMCHVSTTRDSVGLRTTVSRVSWSPPSQVEAGVSEQCPAGAGKDGGSCQRKLWTSKAGHELGPSEAALLGTVLQCVFFFFLELKRGPMCLGCGNRSQETPCGFSAGFRA